MFIHEKELKKIVKLEEMERTNMNIGSLKKNKKLREHKGAYEKDRAH